jgi:hypothetical protein
VGVLGVAAGSYLLVTSAPKKTARGTAVLPLVGKDGGGVLLTGRF